MNTNNTNWKHYTCINKIYNIYFCLDNTIIKDNEVIRYDKDRYNIVEYFLIDKQEKTITCLLDSFIGYEHTDSFVDYFKNNILDIEVIGTKYKDIYSHKYNKIHTVFNIFCIDGNKCYFKTNANNCIVEYCNNTSITIGNNFLRHNIY